MKKEVCFLILAIKIHHYFRMIQLEICSDCCYQDVFKDIFLLPVCVSVCAVGGWGSQREGVMSPGVGVEGGYVLPGMGAGEEVFLKRACTFDGEQSPQIHRQDLFSSTLKHQQHACLSTLNRWSICRLKNCLYQG